MTFNSDSNNQESWLLALKNLQLLSKRQEAFDYARRHFMEIIEKDDFLSLDIEKFIELLKSDNLNVTSEKVVFEVVKRWLAFNHLQPEDALDLLLEVVRLPLLPTEYLLTEVLPYVYPIEKCRRFILEALRWHIYPNDRSKLFSIRTISRNNYVRLVSVGSGFYETSKIIEMYDASVNKWTRLKDINIDKRNIAAAMIDDSLMIIGGYKNEQSQKSVEIVNMLNGSVTSENPMQEERHNVGVVVIGEGKSASLYVIGGYGIGKILRTVERWDPINRQWTFVTPMLTTRNNPGAAALDGKIYVAGGNDGPYVEYFKSLEVYDIKADRWEFKASMIQQRSICRMTAAGNFIYAIGGRSVLYPDTALSNVERYDPKTDTWTFIANISSSGILGLGSLGNNPIYVGGDVLNLMELYDPDKNEWKRLASPNIARDRHNIVQLPHKMIDYKFDW